MKWICCYWSNSESGDAQALCRWRKCLFCRRGRDAAEDELRAQVPVGGDVPGLRDGAVNQRVVVLQVGADVLRGESRPQRVLQHRARLIGRAREGVGVGREAFLQSLDNVAVFKEQYGAGGSAEARDFSAVGAKASAGTTARRASAVMSHSFSCAAPNSTSRRVDCELKADGA